MSVNLEIKERDGVAIISASGRLDRVSASQFRHRVSALVGEGRNRLVADLGGVDYIDSSGLAALISGLKSARESGGELRIAALGKQVRLALELTSLDRVLRPYEGVDAALDGL